MQPFEYTSPTSASEVIELLGAGETRALAGGTDLLTLMKSEVVTPQQLVNLKHTDLPRGIMLDGDTLTIGALTPLSEIESSALAQQHAPALIEAIAVAATPQLRNMATLGGNLLQRPRCWYFRSPAFHCWLKGGSECQARDGENQHHAIFDRSPCVAVHPSDPVTALVALDAEIVVRGTSGERNVPIAEFFALPTDERRTENILGDAELIVAVRVPPHGMRGTYLKAMDRKVWAFALVSVAAMLRLDAGRIAGARVVLGGVAPVPWRSAAAEQVLIGQQPDAGLFERAAQAALVDAQPLKLNGYKVPLAQALIRQALAALTD